MGALAQTSAGRQCNLIRSFQIKSTSVGQDLKHFPSLTTCHFALTTTTLMGCHDSYTLWCSDVCECKFVNITIWWFLIFCETFLVFWNSFSITFPENHTQTDKVTVFSCNYHNIPVDTLVFKSEAWTLGSQILLKKYINYPHNPDGVMGVKTFLKIISD